MDSPARPSGQPADLLVVEDDPDDVHLLKETFRDASITNTMHVVTDGEEALDFAFQRREHADAPRPDLVLLDWDLPGRSGEKVLQELKDDPGLDDVPVVVLADSRSEEDVDESYDLRANACVTKPVDPERFIDVVRSFEAFWLEVVRFPPDDEE